MPPAHVPDSLRTGPFRLADARAAGLTRRQLDSAEWHRLSRDLYVHCDVTESPSAGIVGLSDARSESPMESRTRLLIVDGGLPRPDLQYVVRDENGIFVARLDLAYPVLRIGIDYDGRVHNDDKVMVRDGRRRNRLLAVGWTPLTFYADDYDRAGGRAILTQVGEAVTAARRVNAG